MSEETMQEEAQEQENEQQQGQQGEQQAEQQDDESLLGQKQKEENAEEAEKVEVKIPESYEFKMPEGRELDKGMVEMFTPVLKELKIGQDGAQKLVDLFIKSQESNEGKYKEITEGWKKQTISDLGTEHKQQLLVANRFIDKFGDESVRQVLNDTGLGNHPAVVKMFIKAGKHFGNDSVATGQNKTNAVTDPERAARRFFRNTKYE